MNLNLLKQVDGFSNDTEESVVWRNLLEGDRKSLAYIYSKYFESLYNYGAKITRNSTVIEDAIQDLFIEIWNKRVGLDHSVKNVKYYLYKCLRRAIIHKLSAKSNIEAVDITSFELELSHKSHFLNHQIDFETRQRMMAIIETLTPKEKEAIFLIYFDELSYVEAASIMSLKIKTVYNLIHRAISKLKGRKHSFWQMATFLF